MFGTIGYALGILAGLAGLAGAGLRPLPPFWGPPRFLPLALTLYALQLFVWSLVHRGDGAAMARDRASQDARARRLLGRLGHPGIEDLDEVQALAAAYWLFVAALGLVLTALELVLGLIGA